MTHAFARKPRTRSLALAAAALVLSALASGCGGGNDESQASVADAASPGPESAVGSGDAASASTAAAATAAAAVANAACEGLAGTTVAGATIVSASMVAASDAAPAYCKVSASVDPNIQFEVRMPGDWNRRFVYRGGGGFDGSIPAVDPATLAHGFASVSSDSGHRGGTIDASWALGDAQAVTQFAYASVPTVAAATRAILEKHYGDAPEHAYFEGCSNGGREALMAAQRSPQSFDGIVAMAPAWNFTGLALAYNRNMRAMRAGALLSAAKVQALSQAVLDACDADDGLRDGVVSRPSTCRFDPQALRCTAQDTDACLTDTELQAIATYTSDTAGPDGTVANRGWPLTGGEADPSAWPVWVTGDYRASPPQPPLQLLFEESALRFLITGDPLLNTSDFDANDHAEELAASSALLDAASADLDAFRARGGKLVLWHGLSDPAISPNGTIDYYGRLASRYGQADADRFVRLYLAPGVSHCVGGRGADTADLVSAVDDWVSNGRAPDTLLAQRRDEAGDAVLARPLCAYPRYPRYGGSGDTAAAASFSCERP